jgi:para-nitrobenzyl esterase
VQIVGVEDRAHEWPVMDAISASVQPTSASRVTAVPRRSLKVTPNTPAFACLAPVKWVRDNIAEFGGDSGNITIFGQSSGGGKVSNMMAMPAGAGLFHRAIVESGSYARNAHLEAMSRETATGHARTYLAALNVAPVEAATKLPTLPLDALVAGLSAANQAAVPPTWRPVADGKTLPMGPWWPDGPAISANVPLMIGTTETEMTMLIGTVDPSTFALDDDGLRTRLAKLFAAEDIESSSTRSRPPGRTRRRASSILLSSPRTRSGAGPGSRPTRKPRRTPRRSISTSSTGTLRSATESG